jgi:hypothetical protein
MSACEAGFLLDGAFISVDCTPIKESAPDRGRRL